MHQALAVEEVNGFRDLQKYAQTLRMFPVFRQTSLRHPILQGVFTTQLHLNVQVDFRRGLGPQSWGGPGGAWGQAEGEGGGAWRRGGGRDGGGGGWDGYGERVGSSGVGGGGASLLSERGTGKSGGF